MPRCAVILAIVLFAGACSSPATAADVPIAVERVVELRDASAKRYDLVVVGGTPGGVACAVRTAREGLAVLLVNRHRHLGGILTSGLGVWDTQFEGRRSPIYDEVRKALFDYYRDAYGPKSQQYQDALPGKTGYTNGRFEPKVAEHVINQLVNREERLDVLLDAQPTAVSRDGTLVRSVTLTSGEQSEAFAAAAFVDATYEGDLAALAKVPYRVGREAHTEYDEPHAGIVFMRPSSLPTSPEGEQIAALHDSLRLRQFSGWQDLMPESSGAADAAVQACNYRTILTSDAANRVAIAKPKNYAPYFLKSLEIFSGVDSIPNAKFGWNRPQLIGLQTPYVEADAATRKRLEDECWQTTLALLYFLQNDLTVPELVRRGWQEYGLAKDEFVDNGNRPYEMYVREARRIVGRKIFKQQDAMLAPACCVRRCMPTPWRPPSGTWIATPARSRTPGGLDEGKFMLHHQTFPGQIPYASLLPQGVDNLLVPVCLSATHVAWGTVRLEPVWMQTGEAAGVAAALAHREKTPPARVDADRLIRELSRRRFLLSFFNDLEVAAEHPVVEAAQYFGTQGFFHHYDAKLNLPLNGATARAWAAGLKRLLAGSANPAQLVGDVHQAEAESKTTTLTTAEFYALLSKSPPAESSSELPLERGEALRIMFALLPSLTP
ncbi:MAG: FAD-dependent oxidoreductase [Pirellulales bacterium]